MKNGLFCGGKIDLLANPINKEKKGIENLMVNKRLRNSGEFKGNVHQQRVLKSYEGLEILFCLFVCSEVISCNHTMK